MPIRSIPGAPALSAFRLDALNKHRSGMSKAKPAALPPDTMIGGYRIIRKVAAGGFGVVYLALDADGQQVAVKESVLPFKRFRTPLGKTVNFRCAGF